ncbi:hypothetical protein ACVWZR_000708 [Bradyrhizobium sp. i1.3.1]
MSEKLRILLTGFGPFPGAPYNPTQPLVARLAQLRRPALDDVALASHIFPVTYAAVDRQLPDVLAKEQPDALLMFGLAARTPYLRIETRARNAVTMLWPDAANTRSSKRGIAGHADAMTFGPQHGKAAARRAPHRHRRARLARCRRLSLQLSELARDRECEGGRTAACGVHPHSPARPQRRGAAQGRSPDYAGGAGGRGGSDADGAGGAGKEAAEHSDFVGWQRRVAPCPPYIRIRVTMVGTLPPSLFELRRTSRFAHPTAPSLR